MLMSAWSSDVCSSDLGSGIRSESGVARCHAELANYFAAAFLMPYQAFYEAAEGSNYDVDRLAAAFGVSFEQVCHRLTTLQREGSERKSVVSGTSGTGRVDLGGGRNIKNTNTRKMTEL